MGTKASIFQYIKVTIHYIGSHTELVHASNWLECKKVTMHHIDPWSSSAKRSPCIKLTTHPIGSSAKRSPCIIFGKHQIGLSTISSPQIIFGHASYWPHITLSHASNRLKCKKVTTNYPHIISRNMMHGIYDVYQNHVIDSKWVAPLWCVRNQIGPHIQMVPPISNQSRDTGTSQLCVILIQPDISIWQFMEMF